MPVKFIFFFLLVFNTYSKDDVSLSGTLTLEKEKKTAKFQLIKTRKNYLMRVRPAGSQNSCSFIVRKISAPQKTRGRDGIVFTNRPRQCTFNISHAEDKKFWNKIVLLDFRYQFSSEIKLEGSANLSTLNGPHSAVLEFDN